MPPDFHNIENVTMPNLFSQFILSPLNVSSKLLVLFTADVYWKAQFYLFQQATFAPSNDG